MNGRIGLAHPYQGAILQTRETASERLFRCIDAFAALPAGAAYEVFDLTNEADGERGMAFKLGEQMFPFSLSEIDVICPLLRDCIAALKNPADILRTQAMLDAIVNMAAMIRGETRQ